MYFYLIGIDYKAAPFLKRESFWRDFPQIAGFWQARTGQGTVLLRTCNRIEIYGKADFPDDAFSAVRAFKQNFADFFSYAYVKYSRKEVLQHALRLAIGLESELQGESEILSQLKSWLAQKDFPAEIAELWNIAISQADPIRKQVGLNKDVPNLAKIVFSDLSKFITLGQQPKIIVVGTGKIAELLASNRPNNWQIDFAAHKNFPRAKSLALKTKGQAFWLKDLPQAIRDTQVLISATASPHYIFKEEELSRFLAGRREPLFVYDLSTPRDIEPSPSGKPNIFLQGLNDLSWIFRQENQKNAGRLRLAERLIDEVLQAEEFVYGRSN